MKELKFRVWEEREKEYDTWSYILDDSGNLFRNAYGALIECDKKDYIIEQYTGLKDKNGKEIYEGDIVEYDWYIRNDKSYRVKEKVVFDDMGARVCGHNRIRNCPGVEIIGNIHENTNLLGDK